MDKLVEKCLPILRKVIEEILDDDPQLELQVNRGHWERLLPIILTKALPLIAKEIKGELENLTYIGEKDLFVEIDKDKWHTFWKEWIR